MSLKAALDLDWDDVGARSQGLRVVLQALAAVERWFDGQPEAADGQVQASRVAAAQVRAQDVELAASGEPMLRRGVSRERRISVQDAQMRHGRKTTGARVAACASTATNGMCCTIWRVGWSVRWA